MFHWRGCVVGIDWCNAHGRTAFCLFCVCIFFFFGGGGGGGGALLMAVWLFVVFLYAYWGNCSWHYVFFLFLFFGFVCAEGAVLIESWLLFLCRHIVVDLIALIINLNISAI